MRTVNDEMSDEQRRDELLQGLNATEADKVFVDVSHAIQAVGIDAAEKCVESLVEMEELENPRAQTARSAFRYKSRRRGLAQVDRAMLLEACRAAKQEANKSKIETAITKLNY